MSLQRARATATQQATTAGVVGTDQDNTVLLDNVSEESVELELPPPMVELQALPTATAVASVEDETEEIRKLEDGDERMDGSPPQLVSRSPSTLNISTMGGGELQVRMWRNLKRNECK